MAFRGLWSQFEVTLARQEAGIKLTRDVYNFYRKRAQLEDEYAKKLQKLADQTKADVDFAPRALVPVGDGGGDGRVAVDLGEPHLHTFELFATLVDECAARARMHENLAGALVSRIANPSNDTKRQLKKKRDVLIAENQAKQKEREELEAVVAKASKKHASADRQFQQDASNFESHRSAKNAAKLEERMHKSEGVAGGLRADLEAAEAALAAFEARYEGEDMPYILEQMQFLEEDRIASVRSSVRRAVDLETAFANTVAAAFAAYGRALDDVSDSDELEAFVALHLGHGADNTTAAHTTAAHTAAGNATGTGNLASTSGAEASAGGDPLPATDPLADTAAADPALVSRLRAYGSTPSLGGVDDSSSDDDEGELLDDDDDDESDDDAPDHLRPPTSDPSISAPVLVTSSALGAQSGTSVRARRRSLEDAPDKPARPRTRTRWRPLSTRTGGPAVRRLQSGLRRGTSDSGDGDADGRRVGALDGDDDDAEGSTVETYVMKKARSLAREEIVRRNSVTVAASNFSNLHSTFNPFGETGGSGRSASLGVGNLAGGASSIRAAARRAADGVSARRVVPMSEMEDSSASGEG